MIEYKSTQKDWEKARGISNRLKRLNLIKELKNKAVELQDYSSATWIRQIGNEIVINFLYEDDEGMTALFDLIDKRIDKLEDGEFKKYLISKSREYKIDKLLDNKKPS